MPAGAAAAASPAHSARRGDKQRAVAMADACPWRELALSVDLPAGGSMGLRLTAAPVPACFPSGAASVAWPELPHPGACCAEAPICAFRTPP